LSGEKLPELIEQYNAQSMEDETDWIISSISGFLKQGLSPEDIMIVALDDRHMKRYFKEPSAKLASIGVASNNIHADPYSDPLFTIPDKVTLSTIYRAKGNESAVVFVIGVDAISLKTREDRNKLFTALIRTKAWRRVSGMQGSTGPIIEEMSMAEQHFPSLRFTMPDLSELNMIQRASK
jgi:superfamily I DNA and RNA helicase